MGTMNSANPLHVDLGIGYRQATKDLTKLFDKNYAFLQKNPDHKKAKKAHDLLLAKLAVISCYWLDHDYRLSKHNETAKEYYNETINIFLFDSFFNHMITNIRRI